MERVSVGLLGLGTVGTGVARLLIEQADRIVRRSGRHVEIKWAVVRDLERARACPLPPGRIVSDVRKVLDDPEFVGQW